MRVLDVLVVLAVLVAVVRLPVEERDDERVLEPDVERVRASVHLGGAGNKVVAQQRPAARAVDQDVARLEHRHRVVRRHDGRCALYAVGPARVDQVAERLLDGVERTEPQRPVAQERHQVGGNGLSEREALVELWWVEDRLDAVSVDGIGAVALDRVRDEVGRELDHAGPRVLVALLVEPHGEALHRLEQRREQKTDGPCADDVHADARGQGLERCGV